MVKRWERKQNELRYVWGTLQEEEDATDKGDYNDYFEGMECFNNMNDEITLQNFNIYEGYAIRVINIIASFLIIVFSVYVFVKLSEVAGAYAGILNTIIIGATNSIYKKVAFELNIKENYKYEY